jgi:Ni,Fe-hydrogenase III small subunit
MRNEDEGLAEITSGIAAGATVVVGKLDGVKPGAKVRLPGVPAAPAAPVAAVPATTGTKG